MTTPGADGAAAAARLRSRCVAKPSAANAGRADGSADR